MLYLLFWRRVNFFFFSTLLLSFFVITPAAAKDPELTIRHESMAAKYAGQSAADPIEIEVGQLKNVIVKFKNVGTETWTTEGRGFVSAYTVEPRDRLSIFRGPDWLSGDQTAPIARVTKPGQIGELVLTLKAPEKVGTYTEEFHLAAENYTWVKGGYFFLKIKVLSSSSSTPPIHPLSKGGDILSKSSTIAHKANKFIQNKKSVTAVGGERVELIVGFQNVGQTTWTRYGLAANQPTALASAATPLSFADELWHTGSVIFEKEGQIDPGEVVRENFIFRAPGRKGLYTAQFHLQINGEQLEEPVIELPVTVTEDAPFYADALETQPASTLLAYRLSAEPRIRVGLWRPPEFAQFRSDEDDYLVFTGETQRGVLPRGRFGILKIQDGQYSFKGGDLDILSADYIRLAPANNPHAAFTLWNYERWVKWKGPNNFNQYRGALEYRRGEVKEDVWIVNDLLLEDYVKGIGENANSSPTEYLKSQTVAQRSYAYATVVANKYGIFDVVATTGDQLYLGVEAERITPNFVAAAQATRGQMVAYEGSIVITPYFGNSDCRTRAWTEKWGGAVKPWLVSVKTNYDCARGRRKNGHGVGMSQLDASARAKEEGLDHVALVKYYYTGVEVERAYE